MRLRNILLVLVAIGFLTPLAYAGGGFINYQSILSDENGLLDEVTLDITFKLYDAEDAVDPLWWQTFTGVTTSKKGKINLKLGEGKEIPDTAFTKDELWLGVMIVGDPDGEMVPRTEMGASPFAYLAKTVLDKAIGKEKLDTLAVDSSKIADKAIRKENIKDKAIGKEQLDTLAVDSSKIADKGIRKENIKDKAVGKEQLDTLAVDSSKIADKGIRKENIKDKAIGKAQLDTLAVDSSKIADKGIRKENIKDKAVGKEQLDTLAVDSSKIADKGIRLRNIAQNGAVDGYVIKWNTAQSRWIAAPDEGGTSGNYWTLVNGALFTSGEWGIARSGSTLNGLMWQTHVNLGVNGITGDPIKEYIYCTVSGGYANSALDRSSTVGGGESNLAEGKYSAVPGGRNNGAIGHNSFAAGTLAKAHHAGSIVIAANTGLGGAQTFNPWDSVWTDRQEQMVLRADSGFYLTDQEGASDDHNPNKFLNTSTGAHLTKSGIWQSVSDRNKKENFAPLSGREILEKIDALPISQWNYKIDDDDVRHIGPVAQDFYAVFGLGTDDKTIATIDEAGIALAAIQELHRKSQKIDELEAKVAKLEQLVQQLLANDK